MRKTILCALLIVVTLLSACGGTGEPQVPVSQREVEHVISLIDAIGKVGYTSLSAINRAEHAYNALTEEQKQQVINAQTLLDARKTYNELVSVPKRGRFDRTKLQIGAYCYRQDLWNDADMIKLVEAGINLIPGAPYDKTLLDLCARHGVGVFLYYLPYAVTATPEQYEQAIASYEDHPAVWAVDIIDEPNAKDMPHIGELTKLAEEKFPAGLGYINLFPTYANTTQLGTKTYKEHVDTYVQYVDTDYISFDHYMYTNNSRLLSNLQIVADACDASGRDLWVVLEVSNKSRLLNRGEIGIQAYLALAYGTRLINWACWTYGWYEPDFQIVDSKGNYTAMYDELKAVNHELQKFSDEYMQFKRVATFHLGETGSRLFDGAALPPVGWTGQNVFTSLAIDNNGTATVGYFEKNDGSEYALVVANVTDIRGNPGENTFTFRVPFAKTVTATVAGEKIPLTPDENGVYSVTIPYSGGTFITATRDETAAFKAEVAASAAKDANVQLNLSTLGFGVYTDNGAAAAEELKKLGIEFVVGQAANGAVEALADKGIGLFATDFYFGGSMENTLGMTTSSVLSYSDFKNMSAFMKELPGFIVSDGTISDIPKLSEISPNGIFAIRPPFIKRSGPALSLDYAYAGAMANASHYAAANGKAYWHVVETREVPSRAIGAPSASQLAWQIDAAFAFGARKVIFTSYETLADSPALMAAAQAGMERWQALAPIYNEYTYQHAYVAGKDLFSGKLPLTRLETSLANVPKISNLSADGPAIFGLFANEKGGTAVMIVFGDTERVLKEDFSPVTATITLAEPAKKVTVYVDGKPQSTSSNHSEIQITFDGPAGVFITIE